jgi:GTP-binding protein
VVGGAFDLPGTTRDAISVPFEHASGSNRHCRASSKSLKLEAIEKFSVVKTLQAIENNVVLLLL